MRKTLRLTNRQTWALLEADWLADDGPVRLSNALALDDLSRSLVLAHARIVMACAEAEDGLKLTAAGNFQRRFVERMVDEFCWPDYESETIWRVNKVINEQDFLPLHFLHALLSVARLGRKTKGVFRLTRLGRSLLPPDDGGALNATLFHATFKRYNLAYLDAMQATDNFHRQIGLTLYLLGQFGERPRPTEELMAACTLPIDPLQTDYPIIPEVVFAARVLRYLEWFGLLKTKSRAANDEVFARPLYCKTPLYDRFLSFDLGPPK